MSDSDRPEIRAFHELEALVRSLGEELEETGRRTMEKFKGDKIKANGKTSATASPETPISSN